ncbi:MAG: hypothetical protein J6U64_04360, partial [Alphaproteobacteria bacterium]|nr:hypothetical protein [Alphaproteobacteria bacterium]
TDSNGSVRCCSASEATKCKGNKVFDRNTCGCVCNNTCPIDTERNSETCACECTLTDAECQSRSLTKPYADANTCSCICNKTEKARTCPANKPDVNNLCECVCDRTQHPCTNPAEPDFYEDTCQCECRLTDAECESRGLQFNPNNCKCECLKRDADCYSENPALPHVDQATCGCTCNPDKASGKSDTTPHLDTTTCTYKCIENEVRKYATSRTPDYDATNCRMWCDPALHSCDEENGLKLNSNTCQCECVLTDNDCATKTNGARPHANRNTCQCECVESRLNCYGATPDKIVSSTECACGCAPYSCPPGYTEDGACGCVCNVGGLNCTDPKKPHPSARLCECTCDPAKIRCTDPKEPHIDRENCDCWCDEDRKKEECAKLSATPDYKEGECACWCDRATREQECDATKETFDETVCGCVCDPTKPANTPDPNSSTPHLNLETCTFWCDKELVKQTECPSDRKIVNDNCDCVCDENHPDAKCDPNSNKPDLDPDTCTCTCKEKGCDETSTWDGDLCRCKPNSCQKRVSDCTGPTRLDVDVCECVPDPSKCGGTTPDIARDAEGNYVKNDDGDYYCICDQAQLGARCASEPGKPHADPNRCICECNVDEIECSGSGKYIDQNTCSCECSLTREDCFGAKPHFDEEKCECTCASTDATCTRPNRPHIDLDTCDCICNEERKADECRAENPALPHVNPTTCGCTCDSRQEDCSLTPETPHFISNNEFCGCGCVEDLITCDATGAKPHKLRRETETGEVDFCGCTCLEEMLPGGECTGATPHFKSTEDFCGCECNLDTLTETCATTPATPHPVKNEETCGCDCLEEMLEEPCTGATPYFKHTLPTEEDPNGFCGCWCDAEAKRAECATTPEEPVFDEENCRCICDKNEDVCGRENKLFDSDTCSCVCPEAQVCGSLCCAVGDVCDMGEETAGDEHCCPPEAPDAYLDIDNNWQCCAGTVCGPACCGGETPSCTESVQGLGCGENDTVVGPEGNKSCCPAGSKEACEARDGFWEFDEETCYCGCSNPCGETLEGSETIC